MSPSSGAKFLSLLSNSCFLYYSSASWLSQHLCHLCGGQQTPAYSPFYHLTSLPTPLAGFKRHFSDSHLLSPWAGEGIVFKSISRAWIEWTAVRQNKRIISCWYLWESEIEGVSSRLQNVWSVVDCVWEACFLLFIHPGGKWLKALACFLLLFFWYSCSYALKMSPSLGSIPLKTSFKNHIHLKLLTMMSPLYI